MTDKKDHEKELSFKEQILRDLEDIRKEDLDTQLASSVDEEHREHPGTEEVKPSSFKEEKGNDSSITYPTVEEMMALHQRLESEQAKAISETPKSPEEHKAAITVNYAKKASASDDYVESPVSRNPAVKVPHSDLVEEAEKRKALREKEKAARKEAYTRSNRQAKKRRSNRTAGRIVAVVLVFLLIGIGATGVVGYHYVNSALQPVDKTSKEFVTVEIPAGSGSKAIGLALEKAGLIRNATIFNLYTQLKNYSGFQSGYYNLKKSMSVDDLAKALQEGGTETPQPPALAKLVIPEGYTLQQIATAVDSATKDLDKKISSEELLKKAQDDNFIAQLVAKYPKLLETLPATDSGVRYRLEGYLFPATYNITASTTVESLIEEMVAAMDTNLSSYYDQIAAQNRTVNEVLSLASLVEKEGATDEDRKNIASVFFNRIAQGMPLQSNIAILYAQGKLGEKTTLQEDAQIDTNIDSPFNIYKNTGLTPGPVDSPSLSAITAVINPNNTDYLYFVADVKTGKVYYANNFAEHEQNVTTYVNNQIASSSSEQQ